MRGRREGGYVIVGVSPWATFTIDRIQYVVITISPVPPHGENEAYTQGYVHLEVNVEDEMICTKFRERERERERVCVSISCLDYFI